MFGTPLLQNAEYLMKFLLTCAKDNQLPIFTRYSFYCRSQNINSFLIRQSPYESEKRNLRIKFQMIFFLKNFLAHFFSLQAAHTEITLNIGVFLGIPLAG